jgi:hypothetical protein
VPQPTTLPRASDITNTVVYSPYSYLTQSVAEGNCRNRFAMAEGPIMKEKIMSQKPVICVSEINGLFELSTAFCFLGVVTVDIKQVKS